VPSNNNINMESMPISTAPFDQDLEVTVINYDGTGRTSLRFQSAGSSAAGSTPKPKDGSKCTRRTGASGRESLD